MKYILSFFIFILCMSFHNGGKLHKPPLGGVGADFDIQGHRGCRGLMPENTVPAMLKALDLGVTTLEMDVVVSKDNKVIVSHEPWFAAEITTPTSISPKFKFMHYNYLFRMHKLFALLGISAQNYLTKF